MEKDKKINKKEVSKKDFLYKNSIWETEKDFSFGPLKENIDTDILIVGGGITGISCCYYLKDTSKKIVLIEQNEIGSGITLRTTGKLTYLQGSIYSKIIKAKGVKKARHYYQAQREAMQEVIHIIQKEKIDCDLEVSPSFLFSNHISKFDQVRKDLDKIGIAYQLEKKMPFSLHEEYALSVRDTYVFHPLKYVYGLTKIVEKEENISLYENTRLIKYWKEENGFLVQTNNKQIHCKTLIFANHYPPFLFPYLFPTKAYLEISDIYTFPNKNKKFNAINVDKKTKSIRYQKDMLIYLNNSRKLGTKKKQEELNDFKYQERWNNYDVITPNSLPIIGPIDRNLYLATGFNTWGMTNSNLAARVIASYIKKEENRDQSLVKPKNIGKSISELVNLVALNMESVVLFIKSWTYKNQHYITYIKGKKYGIYVDKDGKKHMVSITCPHMKCGLRFNDQDLTWECICHGSKFDIDGNVLKGPSTTCIKKDTLF